MTPSPTGENLFPGAQLRQCNPLFGAVGNVPPMARTCNPCDRSAHSLCSPRSVMRLSDKSRKCSDNLGGWHVIADSKLCTTASHPLSLMTFPEETVETCNKCSRCCSNVPRKSNSRRLPALAIARDIQRAPLSWITLSVVHPAR